MLKFDEFLHEYRWDGKVVPSVTQIIPRPDFGAVSPDVLEFARIEGVMNHIKIKEYLDGDGATGGDEYIEDFQQFLFQAEVMLGKLTSHETPLFHPSLMFAGTPDLVFERGIVDIKRTLGKPRAHALQLAGYQLLVDNSRAMAETYKSRNWIIAWRENRKFLFKNIWNDQATTAFRLLLQRRAIDDHLKLYEGGI